MKPIGDSSERRHRSDSDPAGDGESVESTAGPTSEIDTESLQPERRHFLTDSDAEVETPKDKLEKTRPPVERIAEFKLSQLLGEGGMGSVYAAFDETLHRYVAIKIIKSSYETDATAVRRFKREAMAAASISHPNVVPIHRIGEEQGYHYIVMQLVEGESLSALLRRRERLPVDEALRITEQCLAGLSAAHRKGLVHRDIKPSNILIDHETKRALIADFGLARFAISQTQLTSANNVVGTPAYLAPEQCRGGKVDPRTDLYALGVTLYQMLAGRLPFVGSSGSLAYQHVHEMPPPLTNFQADLCPEVVAITHKLLAKSPDKRYESADALLADISAVRRQMEAETPAARDFKDTPAGRTKSPQTRFHWLVAGLCSLVGIATVAVIFTMLAGGATDGPTPEASATPPGISDGPLEEKDEGADIAKQNAPNGSDTPPPEADERIIENTVGMTFVRIPAGTFQMGGQKLESVVAAEFNADLESVAKEYPSHEVTLTHPFYLSAYEVTQGQFERVMGANPSVFQEADSDERNQLPVENITWNMAVEFCQRLSDMTEEKKHGRVYRLPTEAEWEYACRAKSTTYFCFGDDPQQLGQYAWYNSNSQFKTHIVGQKLANPFGLYDMHGNVAEWCQDRYDKTYYRQQRHTDPTGPVVGLHRVARGGAWNASAFSARSANRDHASPSLQDHAIGFRVVMIPEMLDTVTAPPNNQ